MDGSRTATALAGLLASIAISVGIYLATGWLVGFLFVPFVPFLFSASSSGETDDTVPPIQHCPECDFRTRAPDHDYCPRDGHRLREE